MKYGVYRGVVSFNMGAAAVGMAVGEIGMEAMEIRKRMDRKRFAGLLTTTKKKEEIKERKIRKVQEEEENKAAEGEAYRPEIGAMDA